MNVNVPEKTRPPAEMMAQAYLQDEDEESGNSASELDGESIMMASSAKSPYVSADALAPYPHFLY